MPRTCTICSHPKRKQIEKAIAAGEVLRNIAKQYDVGFSAIQRHKDCIPASLEKAREKRAIKYGDSLLEQLAELRGYVTEILETSGDSDTRLKAVDRRHKQIELEAKLQGEFKQDQANPVDQAALMEATAKKLVERLKQKGQEVTYERALEMVSQRSEAVN